MVNKGDSMDGIWYIWVKLITTSLFSLTGIMVFIGESSPKARTIQVSEIL